jgi:tetratricopeptide (TPR) repeat protein
MARIDQIRSLLEQDPTNSRIQFMLCMEHVSAGAWAEARAEFDRLIGRDPDYVAAYFQAGRTCEELGDVPAARQCYQQGIEAAHRKGDAHSLSELQGALDMLG